MSKKRNNKPGSHSIEFFCSLENALSPCVYCPILNGVSNEKLKWMIRKRLESDWMDERERESKAG